MREEKRGAARRRSRRGQVRLIARLLGKRALDPAVGSCGIWAIWMLGWDPKAPAPAAQTQPPLSAALATHTRTQRTQRTLARSHTPTESLFSRSAQRTRRGRGLTGLKGALWARAEAQTRSPRHVPWHVDYYLLGYYLACPLPVSTFCCSALLCSLSAYRHFAPASGPAARTRYSRYRRSMQCRVPCNATVPGRYLAGWARW